MDQTPKSGAPPAAASSTPNPNPTPTQPPSHNHQPQTPSNPQHQTPQDELPEEPIPALTSIAPAIFVPITTDLTAPFTPPPTRPDRLRAILSNQETHAAQVRSNLCSLFERETARIMQVSREQEPLFLAERGLTARDYDRTLLQPPSQSPQRGWRASPADLDSMVANMAAQQPAGMRRAGSIVDVPTPDLATLPGGNTPRERATRECLTLLSKGTGELKGYEAHVGAKKEFYERALKRELEREAE